jgi:hypothetical protein
MNLRQLIAGCLLAAALGAATAGFGAGSASADPRPTPP